MSTKIFTTFLFQVIILITVSAQANYSPEEFGDNQWVAHSYNGYSFQNHRGYYIMPGTDFDTRNYWSQNSSPSSASSYVGQNVTGSFFSLRIKRAGFPCGEYTLHTPAHAWRAVVIVNGTTVYNSGFFGGGQNNIWTGYLDENSTIEYELQVLIGAGYANFQMDAIPNVLSVWSGSENRDWFNAANWSQGVPDDRVNAVIPSSSNSPVIDGQNAEAGSCTIETNGELEIQNDGVLELSGDMMNSGNLLAESGIVRFESSCGTSQQEFYNQNSQSIGQLVKTGDHPLLISGAEINIITELNLISGALTTNDLIVLKSDANKTACLAPVSDEAELIGEITAERYISPVQNGWVHLCSPVSGQTFESWNESVLTTGFPGADYPNFSFNNIRMYDETETGHMDIGLYNASHVSDPIENLKGYQIYMSPGATTVSVKGEAITGTRDFGLTFTSSEPEFDAAYSAEHDGWHLVANPYPSSINWDNPAGWDKENLTGSIHIWDATLQQYTAYAQGVGVNGGAANVPSGQAFWVQANGDNPVLRIKEQAKSGAQGMFRSTQSNEAIYLSLANGSGTDQIAFRVLQSEQEFAEYQDIPKLYSSEAVPKIGVSGESTMDWAIKNLLLEDDGAAITLNSGFAQSGSHTISVDLQNYSGIHCILLEDTETGVWTDLRNDDYTFETESSDIHDRFVVHFGAPFTAHISHIACPGETNGGLSWDNPEMWDVLLLHEDFFPGDYAGLDSFNDLPAGMYEASISTQDGCVLEETFSFEILAPAEFILNESVTAPSCHNSTNGQVSLEVSGGTAPYEVLWSDLDTATTRLDLEPGSYGYMVTDAAGCTTESAIDLAAEISVEALFDVESSVINVGEPVAVVNNSVGAVSYNWLMGDSTGLLKGFAPYMAYDTPGVYTLQLIAQTGACSDEFSREIEVVDQTTSIEENSSSVNVYSNNGQVFVRSENPLHNSVQLNIYNSVGQELYRKSEINLSGGNVIVPISGQKVVIVQIIDEQDKLVKSQKLFMGR